MTTRGKQRELTSLPPDKSLASVLLIYFPSTKMTDEFYRKYTPQSLAGNYPIIQSYLAALSPNHKKMVSCNDYILNGLATKTQ